MGSSPTATTDRRDQGVKGNIETMPHWAGEGVGSMTSILPAGEIVDQLAGEAEKLLKRWT